MPKSLTIMVYIKRKFSNNKAGVDWMGRDKFFFRHGKIILLLLRLVYAPISPVQAPDKNKADKKPESGFTGLKDYQD